MKKIILSILLVIVILALWILLMRIIMKKRVSKNSHLPKPAFYIMNFLLRIKNRKTNINNILKSVGLEPNTKILDYGAGIGTYSLESAKIMDNKGKVVAADISEVMINTIDDRVKRSNLGIIHPFLIKTLDDIKEDNFDLILLIDVIHFIKNKVEFIDSLMTKLSKKGRLLVKFEHIKRNDILSILENIKCQNQKNIQSKFWILTKQ